MSHLPLSRVPISHVIATFFFVGHLRPAPGTWGSAAALPVAWLLYTLGSWPLLLVATVLLYGAGVWATRVETTGKADHDPSEIVVDEVVGQWIALWPVAIGAAHAGVAITALWPGILTAFVAFRLFDITKPGPVGWADRQATAAGVMNDDVIAGLMAACTVGLFAYLAHSVFA